MFQLSPDQIRIWVETHFDVKPRKNRTELIICNPFDGDTGFHFNISATKGVVHDWRGDQWAGSHRPSFLRFVQLYNKCSYAEAIKAVCGEGVSLRSIQLEIARQRNQREKKEVVEEAEILVALPEGAQKLVGSGQPKMANMLLNWLESRGLSKDRVQQLDLHHFADTVIWPYYEYGMLVYWQSRCRTNKVFTFPDESIGVGKTDFFYGFDMIEPNDYVIITEAIFGAHTLDSQCLASGGAGLEDKQVRKLQVFNPTRGVILAPDNDKAGIASVLHNYGLVKNYYPVFCSIPPKIKFIQHGEPKETKDWNELLEMGHTSKQVREIFEKGIRRITFREIKEFAGIIAV